jgi:hypothetical protein
MACREDERTRRSDERLAGKRHERRPNSESEKTNPVRRTEANSLQMLRRRGSRGYSWELTGLLPPHRYPDGRPIPLSSAILPLGCGKVANLDLIVATRKHRCPNLWSIDGAGRA